MKVLLLGKYPPCQGGIAARTYWLFHALAGQGIRADVVTLAPDPYRSAPVPSSPGVRVEVIEPAEGPWFIPGGDLWSERLVAAALKLAAEDRPDIVEANYLAPFGLAALTVARALGIPFVVRHAGSDVAKLVDWEPVARALGLVLSGATFVVTPEPGPAPAPVERAAREGALVMVRRYVPTPIAFCPAVPIEPAGPPTVLLAGKLNYHWRWKAVDTLLDALMLRPDWRLIAVVGGRGLDAVRAEVHERGLDERVDWRPFVSPDRMPALIRQAVVVWAMERAGGPTDFSNLAWESIAVGRACLVSPRTALHPDADLLRSSPGFMVADPDDVAEVGETLDRTRRLPTDHAAAHNTAEHHRAYIEANAALYRRAAGSES